MVRPFALRFWRKWVILACIRFLGRTMNHSPQWPVRHILLGIPLILAVSYIWGGLLKGWGLGEETILAGATLVAVVGAGYTYLVTVLERSYYMVFWAREKIKTQFEEARQEGEARRDRAWRSWYRRLQAAQREGLPFDEPPPDAPGRDSDG